MKRSDLRIPVIAHDETSSEHKAEHLFQFFEQRAARSEFAGSR
ncbi:MAG: hypothetical protein AAF720_02570 [Pseudomonadota bacterium]